MKKIIAILTTATLLSAGVAHAVDLTSDARITGDLTAAAVADKIRNECSSISANMFSALSKANALKKYAKSKGATDKDIKAFLNSKTEKSRINRLRNSYLATNGAVAGNEESYCKIGRDEIAKKSLIGSILK